MISIDDLKAALGSKAALITAGLSADDLTALITEQTALILNILNSISIPDETPPLLIKICKDLCLHEVYLRQSRGDLPEAVQKEYENSYKLLDKILKKQIIFGDLSPTTEEIDAVMSVATRRFGLSL